jgi:hypothetical protein
MDIDKAARAQDSGLAAAAYAQQVRELHRKRSTKGSGNRETDIRVALQRIREAMRPIRSVLGTVRHPLPPEEAAVHRELLRISDAMQRERRKLWKMRPAPKKRRK